MVRCRFVFLLNGVFVSVVVWSCMIMICVLRRTKRLCESSRILLSVMETWQMLGRYVIVGCGECWIWFWCCGLNDFAVFMEFFFFLQEKGNFEIAIRYYLIAIEVCVHSVDPFSYCYLLNAFWNGYLNSGSGAFLVYVGHMLRICVFKLGITFRFAIVWCPKIMMCVMCVCVCVCVCVWWVPHRAYTRSNWPILTITRNTNCNLTSPFVFHVIKPSHHFCH